MEHATGFSGTVGLVESLDTVEFDVDQGRIQATYDSTQDPVGLVVVSVVAAVSDLSPSELPPLHGTIDTDALHSLLGDSPAPGCTSISFLYEGFDVTIHSEGRIEAAPAEKPKLNISQ